jgi:hypothetical protein
VEAIARKDGQPLIQETGLVVEWGPDHTIDESEYDLDNSPQKTKPKNILRQTSTSL